MKKFSVLYGMVGLCLACGGGVTTSPKTDAMDLGVETQVETPTVEEITSEEGMQEISQDGWIEMQEEGVGEIEEQAETQEWPPCVTGKEPGCPCQENSDCDSGYCVLSDSGKVCTKACQAECPAGWTCAEVSTSGRDIAFICVPIYAKLCRPCVSGEDCAQLGGVGGYCLEVVPGQGKFCGGICSAKQLCPQGYTCKKFLIEGKEIEQCWPEDGKCECNEAAKKEEAKTTCYVNNENGTCQGFMKCTPAGLSKCDAATPMPEICDGKDNNCDGSIDEGVGEPCEKTNAFGTCKGFKPCAGGTAGECNAPEPAQEICDGKDNNCDGLIDEGFENHDDDNMADCVDNDDDNDGILDEKDNCPLNPNPNQSDLDGDGIGDVCDLDIDGDGKPNNEDCEPTNPAITCTIYYYDGDGDGYGLCNVKKCICEPQGPYKILQCVQEDCNDSDPDVSPGKPELCDKKDNDCNGLIDDGTPDSDADGILDECDPDDDNDGILDEKDNCPLVPNPDQKDVNKNGIGDACEGDADGDGIPNDEDNCPYVYNPFQEDCDLNGKGDACDDEGDGVVGEKDCAPCDPNIYPGATELCNNKDDNCNGITDEAFPEVGLACDGGDADKCATGKYVCNKDGTGVECNEPGTGFTEVCDGVDNDCDGEIDEGCACTVVICQGGVCTTKPLDCDDKNPCTKDDCDPATGCLHTPLDGATCDDGDPCTKGDKCANDKCVGVPYSCDDGLSCTKDSCLGNGMCLHEILSGFCLINNVCYTVGTVNPANQCEICDASKADGWTVKSGSCDDGNPCTKDDNCSTGVCNGIPYTCDDGIPCTTDKCDGKGGCINTVDPDACMVGGQCFKSGDTNPENSCQYCDPKIANTVFVNKADNTSCDDENSCTKDDKCKAGACVGVFYSCDDGISCTEDICDGKGGCSYKPKENVCIIGNECITEGTENPDNQCQICQPDVSNKDWTNKPNGTSCSDGNACTKSDQCSEGKCVGVTYTCDDNLDCTLDTCDGNGGCTFVIKSGACLIEGKCYKDGDQKPGDQCYKCDPSKDQDDWSMVADGTVCNDGNLCTKNDQCKQGICTGTAYSCDDGKECTEDKCDGNGGCANPLVFGQCLIAGKCYKDGDLNPLSQCQYCDAVLAPTTWTPKPNGEACSDGNECTEKDQCAGGICIGSLKYCNDNNICTDDSCDPKIGCVFTNNTAPCDDGLYCTINDKCSAGKCTGSMRDCTGLSDQCNNGVCDEEKDSCVKSPKPDGTKCDDGNLCTLNDVCIGGVCKGTPAQGCCQKDADCDDKNPCTKDICNTATGNCSYQNLTGDLCDDGLYCTVNDKCQNGVCLGLPRDCSALSDTCNLGSCNEEKDQCEKVPTNEGGPCTSDNNICTDDICQGGVCTHKYNTAPCDDGNLCTYPDQCNQGVCKGSAYSCNDGLDCTDDQCDGKGGCKFVIKSAYCLIDGVCYVHLAPNPANQCLVCNATVNNVGWSFASAGTKCDDGDDCTTSDQCNGLGKCVGVASKDDDKDGFVDAKCGGTDCNDNDPTIKPGVPDPIEGISPLIQTIDTGGYHGQWVSSAIDSKGKVHLAMYNPTDKSLEYGTNQFGLFMIATIDDHPTFDLGQYASIAVDTKDRVHIAYYDYTNKDLKYATNSSGSWVIENVTSDTTADSGMWANIAVTSDNIIHVAYFDNTNKKVIYRRKVGGTWSAANIVDSSQNVGTYLVMTAEPDGKKIHMSYFDTVAGSLKYASGLYQSWTLETVDPSGNKGRPSAIALDANRNPHIIYRDESGYDVKHAWRSATGWSSVIAWNGSSSSYPINYRWGFSVDTNGKLVGCIPWYTTTPTYSLYRLDYSSKTYGKYGSYSLTQIDSNIGSNTWCTVARGPNDVHHIIWYDYSTNQLMYTNDDTKYPGWETIDGYYNTGTWPSIVRGSDGTLHVVYYSPNNQKLWYARKVPGGLWENVQLPGTNNVGQYASIALDAGGKVHIAYYDATAGDLMYINGSWGSWSTPEIVDTTGNVGQYTSIGIGPGNVPYIAYYDVTNTDLKFARKVSGVWQAQTLDNVGNNGMYASMAVGNDGVVHIAYQSGNYVRYIRGTPGVGWNTPVYVDTSGVNGQWIDIALDTAGYPHVSYYNSTNTEVRHSWATNNTGTLWTMEVVDTQGSSGQYGTSIAIDGSNNIYVAYYGQNGYVTMGRKDAKSGIWSFSIPDSTQTMNYTSLAVSNDGHWYIAYYVTSPQDLRLASDTLRGWSSATTIAYPSSSPDQWSSISLGADGTPHVSYYDSSNTALKYAKRVQGLWFHTIVDLGVNTTVGEYSSIVVDKNDVVHFAYLDYSSRGLRYGRLSGGSFVSELVDQSTAGGTYVGYWNSIAVGSDGTIHISYYDQQNRDLKYAYGNLGKWTKLVLDSAGDVGQYSSIAVDGNNKVHIAYYYADGQDLRYISNKTGQFLMETVASTNSVGTYASIAVDKNQNAYISYKDATAYDLMYAMKLSGSWVSQAVDTGNSVGDWTSIALNGAGGAYIGYYYASSADAKFATNISGAWQTFNIETATSAGTYMDIAFGQDKKIYMVYRDATNNDLKGAIITINNAVDQNCDGY